MALFTLQGAAINTAVLSNDPVGLAPFAVPGGNQPINVVDDFRWTLTDKEGRGETPNIQLTEYRVLQSSLINSARYYTAGISQQVVSSRNPYLKEKHMSGYAGFMDFENPTKFQYTFPYFSDIANSVTSSWTALDIVEKARNASSTVEAGGAIGQFAYEAEYPRVGIMDRPKLWESSDFRSINIKFPLFNTVSHLDVEQNWELCFLLTYQNMFNKRDFVTAIPPVFYTVYAPGQFFSIAMYVSDLKIYNRGNTHMYKIGTKWRNVPDVYEIDMTLTDMIMPSQNMLKAVYDDAPIVVSNLVSSEEQGA